MMFGWLSAAAAFASCKKRWVDCSSAEPLRTLIATSRSSTGSWARKTSPMLPFPTFPVISYLPSRWGCMRRGMVAPAGPVTAARHLV